LSTLGRLHGGSIVWTKLHMLVLGRSRSHGRLGGTTPGARSGKRPSTSTCGRAEDPRHLSGPQHLPPNAGLIHQQEQGWLIANGSTRPSHLGSSLALRVRRVAVYRGDVFTRACSQDNAHCCHLEDRHQGPQCKLQGWISSSTWSVAHWISQTSNIRNAPSTFWSAGLPRNHRKYTKGRKAICSEIGGGPRL
jgi:hypothetical protein